jgi:SAM-dependent methyltransferase
MNEDALERLLHLHRGLPRAAPGGQAHTLAALERIPDLPRRPRIVDLGCGPGGQTLDLLRAIEGSTVVAVDLLPEMLAELEARATRAGLRDRVTLVRGDMAEPPPEVHPASFHLAWSEGAAYAMGFDAALRAWRHLLLPGGFIAVSELAWTVPVADRPALARDFFAEEHPGMRGDDENRAAFEACGFELLGALVLPDSAWDAYYRPLSERLPAFEAERAGDPLALDLARRTRREMEVFEAHGHSYGYVFYVARMR